MRKENEILPCISPEDRDYVISLCDRQRRKLRDNFFEIEENTVCACLNCCEIFTGNDLRSVSVDQYTQHDEVSACCPNCGAQEVLTKPAHSTFSVQFLMLMHDFMHPENPLIHPNSKIECTLSDFPGECETEEEESDDDINHAVLREIFSSQGIYNYDEMSDEERDVFYDEIFNS